MKTKTLTKELQESYQTMVDTIEEFVVKEGKTLQQAFYAAEEKLDDAKQISQEEIQQTSRDLKDNLRLLGEAVNGASEAYKEQIKLDMAYVNDSIWGKLQSIADTNTTQLIAFTRALKEEAQAVVASDHLTAHQEHNQWRAEHALWLDEVSLWEKEHDQALTKLEEIQAQLKQQSASLAEHTQAIRAHGETDHEHEKVMSDAEKDPSSDVFEAADEQEAKAHEQERQVHAQHAELHHALKTHHLKTMVMINMLYKEVNKAK